MALNETFYAEEFILSEANGKLSRDEGTLTVAASTTLPPGQVLGKITATGKFVAVDSTASDGREVAAAILVREVANEGLAPADFDALVLNQDAEVGSGQLTWGASNQTTGEADLRAVGIKIRTTVPA